MKWTRFTLVATFTSFATSTLACDPNEVAITSIPAPENTKETLNQALSIENDSKSRSSPDAVILGDSLVARWPLELLNEALETSNVFKMGVEGDKTQNVLWRLQTASTSSWRPRTVILLIGTNNLSAGDSPCAIIKGILTIVSRIDDIWKKPNLIIIPVLPRGNNWDFRQEDRIELNKMISEISHNRRGTNILDLSDDLICNTHWPCANYIPDKLHLSSDGYSFLSRRLGEKRSFR